MRGRKSPAPRRRQERRCSRRPGRGRGARRRRYGVGRGEPITGFISGWRGRHFVRRAINGRWAAARSVVGQVVVVAELVLRLCSLILISTFPAKGICQRRGAAWSRAELRKPPPQQPRAGPPRRQFLGAQPPGPPGRALRGHELRSPAARRGGHDLPQGGQPDLPHLARHAEARLREVRARRRRVHPAGPLHQGVPRLRLRPLPRQARRRGRHGRHGWRRAGRSRVAGADGALRPPPGLAPQPPGAATPQVRGRRLRTPEPQPEAAPPQPIPEPQPLAIPEPISLQPLEVSVSHPLAISVDFQVQIRSKIKVQVLVGLQVPLAVQVQV